MELLDQLEERISVLLSRADALAKENATLKESQERELAALTEENTALRHDLEQERAKATNSLSRLEALIALIREQTDQE